MARFIKESPPKNKTIIVNNSPKKVDEDKDSCFDNIKYQVIKSLGRPKDLMKVEVKNVGGNNYRVNIVCSNYKNGCMIPTISRPNSYYVTTNDVDDTLNFQPDIVKSY